jgi:hypothetical protein
MKYLSKFDAKIDTFSRLCISPLSSENAGDPEWYADPLVFRTGLKLFVGLISVNGGSLGSGSSPLSSALNYILCRRNFN